MTATTKTTATKTCPGFRYIQQQTAFVGKTFYGQWTNGTDVINNDLKIFEVAK